MGYPVIVGMREVSVGKCSSHRPNSQCERRDETSLLHDPLATSLLVNHFMYLYDGDQSYRDISTPVRDDRWDVMMRSFFYIARNSIIV